MTTERVFHTQILIPWLTTPISQDGLGWMGPAAGAGPNNAISQTHGLITSDLLDFIKGGNTSNEEAWAKLVDEERKANGRDGAVRRAEDTAVEAVLLRLGQVDTVLEMFRVGVDISGRRFGLWNRRPSVGDTTVRLAQNDYTKNILRTSPEIVAVGLSELVGRGSKKESRTPKVRLDQGFHLNGLQLGYLELKNAGSGTSAEVHGRPQMAEDFIAMAIPALRAVHTEYQKKHPQGLAWPGMRKSRTLLTDEWKRTARASIPTWFGKTAWRAAADTDNLWLAGSAWNWLLEVDDVLVAQEKADPRREGKTFDWPQAHGELVARLVATFSRVPDTLLDRLQPDTNSGWGQVRAHLRGMLGTTGLDQEIFLFGYPADIPNNRTQKPFELMEPRAPQRAALGQIQAWTKTLYEHEQEAGWLEADLRARLQANLPGLGGPAIEAKVEERLKFRNGQDAYSVIVQGAAGLGKTNIAVWTAMTLHGQLETDSFGRPTSQPMFDYIILLTDRLDLRKNIADAAERDKGSKGKVTEVTNAHILERILAGDAPKGTGRILVVNLHKFPSLREKIKKGEAAIKRSGGRIAFLIDEIHRSNQGKLNADTLDSFLDDLGSLGASSSGKKNLIVGLTATPSDPILARFGLWRPGTGAGDPGCWTPHFAYGMTQAIKDGYVLDPLRSLVRLETTMDVDAVAIVATSNAKKQRIAKGINPLSVYEDPDWQRRTAREFARIFLTVTMRAIMEGRNSNLVGWGKAMVTLPSVKAAIGMYEQIKEAISDLADPAHAEGTAWEKYAGVARDVAEKRVFILYSDPGKRASVAQREDTGVAGECGKLNPLLNGTVRNEEQIIDGFKCKGAGQGGNERNSIIVVVDKLLTGFDEDTLHTLMIARGLQGIGLLQAMCRVNRTRPGKATCLVLDASLDLDLEDGLSPDGLANTKSLGLGPEAARVFHRYGGLAMSHLDGLELLERVAQQRKELLADADIKAGFAQWKQGLDDEAKLLLACTATAGVLSRREGARDVRRAIGGYLSQQALADPIMRLDKADQDPRWLAFLHRVHNAMGANGVDTEQTPIQFTVQDVSWVAQQDEKIDSATPDDSAERPTAQGRLEKELEEDPGADLAFLLGIQDSQEAKKQRMALLRQFLIDLSVAINDVTARDSSLLALANRLKNNQLDPGDAAAAFGKLVAAVSITRTIGADGKKHMWVDLGASRREIMNWLLDPVRMDLVMQSWI